MNGVVIIHGCRRSFFIPRKTLEDYCSMVCPGCGELIGFSLFGSSIGEQLLASCEEFTQEEIDKRIAKT